MSNVAILARGGGHPESTPRRSVPYMYCGTVLVLYRLYTESQFSNLSRARRETIRYYVRDTPDTSGDVEGGTEARLCRAPASSLQSIDAGGEERARAATKGGGQECQPGRQSAARSGCCGRW